MSAEHQKRPPAEMALIEVFDATKEAQQIASAILLAARGIFDNSDSDGLTLLADMMRGQLRSLEHEVRGAQRAIGFAEGGTP
ncbi:hypothetical protein [Methylorubrum suomiense]|uniref:Uncharacterized protein n=1 Tax=Methylorubrum suomiense TaxID=144191 RepID=A0ABQ4UYJ2_9HYPH|nr:hypothetical protein [Methylorubrum suomiense]GJE77256.1 hypothetical protein BGCPKDLD_3859 [Methylorubrum suomiense]